MAGDFGNFYKQFQAENYGKYAGLEDGLSLMHQDAQNAWTQQALQDPNVQKAPEEVLNFFNNYKPSAGSGNAAYTDSQGYEWRAQGDNGLWGTAADQGTTWGRLLRGDELGRKHNEVGSLSSYFDSNGIFDAQRKSERSATWGELLVQLAAAATGIGAVGGMVGAGAAGAAGAGGAAAGGGMAAADLAAMYGVEAGIGGMTAGEAAALYGGGAGLGSGSGAFLGEGVQSGVAAWDGAAGSGFAGAGGTGAMGAGGSGGGGAGGMTGTPPPANPYAAGAGAGGSSGGTLGSIQNILGGTGTSADWLGLAGTALGALGGSQGQEASTTSTRAMDPRMDSLFYGDLAPRTQGLLASTTPQAQLAGSQLMAKGSGLLGQTAPTTATNPYLSSIADDMQRRTMDMLGQNNLAIQGNAVSSGGMGGSRQGVAQGTAAGKAADYLQGNVAGLYGNAYNQDQNRLRQDWTLGSGMLSQGVNMPFAPAQSAAQIYAPFTGTGTTTNSQQSGGGWMGAVGGALGAAQAGKNLGWW